MCHIAFVLFYCEHLYLMLRVFLLLLAGSINLHNKLVAVLYVPTHEKLFRKLGVECVLQLRKYAGCWFVILKLAMYFCLQDNFSDCRSMSDCRCDKECISHEVPGDDLCSELLLWIVTEGCFYYWSNICGCNHDSKRILLHVLHQGDYYSGSSEGKSSKLKYWDGWVCIERIHLGNVIDGYQVLH